MKLNAYAQITLSADDNDRTLTGTIVSFDTPTDDRRGLMIRAGALSPRLPLKRTKLLRDHDHSDPVGYLTKLSDDQLTAEFHIPEGANGDRALTEARNGLRDGLSIGFTIEEHVWDDDILIVTKATFYEVSLVAIPAFQDAGIAAAAAFTTTERNPMPTTETTPVTEQRPSEQLATVEQPTGAPAVPATGELAGTPEPLPAAAPIVHTQPRPVSLAMLAADVSAAIARGDRQGVHQALALSDVLPADDVGKGLLRDDWRGELWQADRTDRPFIDSLGAPQPLRTGSKIKGWAWDVKPDVQDYEGNKKAVPSNKPKTKPVEADVHRSAGGWDIDRIFLDLGEAGFLESFWAAAVADYKKDSETYAVTKAIAGAFELPTQPTLLKSLAKLGAGFAAIGANLDAIFIAPDLFEEYAELTQAEVPFWLANATGVNLRNQSATVADLNIRTHQDLEAGQIVAHDKRSATWFEQSPPIRVNGIDLPKGGVDLGLFGYDGLLINDQRALVKMQVGAAAPGGA